MLCNLITQTTPLILVYADVALKPVSRCSVEQDRDFAE